MRNSWSTIDARPASLGGRGEGGGGGGVTCKSPLVLFPPLMDSQ